MNFPIRNFMFSVQCLRSLKFYVFVILTVTIKNVPQMHLYRSFIVKICSSEKHESNPFSLGKLSGKHGHFQNLSLPLRTCSQRLQFLGLPLPVILPLKLQFIAVSVAPWLKNQYSEKRIRSLIYFYFGRTTITKNL